MFTKICIIFLASTLIRADFPNLFAARRIAKRNVVDLDRQVHHGATPVSYGCPANSVLCLAQAENNVVKLGCGMPTICNQVRSCTANSRSSVCSGKANFLHSAREVQHGGQVSGICCQYSPPVDDHTNDNCYSLIVTDQEVVPKQGGSMTDLLPARSAHAAGGAGAVSADKRKAVMALFFPAPAVQPTQLVKGIMKTITGYLITVCTIQCDKTTTTRTYSTQKAPQQNPPPPGSGSNNGNGNSGRSGGTGGSGGSGHSKEHSGHSKEHSGHSKEHSGHSKEHSGHSKEHSGHSKEHSHSDGHSRNVNYGQQHGSAQQQGSGGAGALPSRIIHYGEGSNSHGSSGDSSGTQGGDVHSSHVGHDGGSEQQQQQQQGHSGSHQSHGSHHSGLHSSHGGSGGGGGGGGCFSAEMTVTTKTGPKRMEELVLGEEVLVATVDNAESFQPIEWFYHQNKDSTTDYVTIVTESNRTLSLTPAHLLTFVPCFPRRLELQDLDSYVNYDSVFARKARPGLCLAAKNGDFFETDVIVSVSVSQKRGVYSPVTTQGTLIVNGIQASCYSIVESHFLQYGMHKCLLYLRNLFDPVWNLFSTTTTTSAKPQLEVPSILWFFLEVAEVVLPSMTY